MINTETILEGKESDQIWINELTNVLGNSDIKSQFQSINVKTKKISSPAKSHGDQIIWSEYSTDGQ